jgi:hypothetical protein
VTDPAGELRAIKALLAEIEPIAAKLPSNERRLFEELKAKYATATAVGFADRRCLEIILRNVKVRER